LVNAIESLRRRLRKKMASLRCLVHCSRNATVVQETGSLPERTRASCGRFRVASAAVQCPLLRRIVPIRDAFQRIERTLVL